MSWGRVRILGLFKLEEQMTESRVLAWVSGGAASVIAAKLAINLYGPERVHLVRCETSNEDEDNLRFEKDASEWLGKTVTLLRSEKYGSVREVWEKRRYMAGPNGAACTLQMKVIPRLVYQRPSDIHVFGYTNDSNDIRRFNKLRETLFELNLRAPLIEAGINKSATLKMVENAQIHLPRSYALGFPNANCLLSGCVKASSPSYWSLFREHFPERFERTAILSRDIGKRLVSIGGKRMFLDELPVDWPTLKPIAPTCDFLCSYAEREMRAPRQQRADTIRRPLSASSPEGVKQLGKLLGLNGLIAVPKRSYQDDRSTVFSIARRAHRKTLCRFCDGTANANGARKVYYVDIPVEGRVTRLEWDRQRYLCQTPSCRKSFSDHHEAFHSTRQITNRLLHWIRERAVAHPFSEIAIECGLSERTVSAIYHEGTGNSHNLAPM